MKNQILSISLLIFILAGCAVDSNENPYKGIVFGDLNELPDFQNYKFTGGTVADGDYTFSSYIDTLTSRRLVVHSRSIEIDGGKQMEYELLDLLYLDPLPENQYISHGSCELNEEWNKLIVVVYEFELTEYYTNIIKAWKIDESTRKFVEFPIEGIRCYNDGYGT
ncbi:MAG: hypothetical protein KDD99_17235 [Bacteroidetes bacterium]|nr:hypothetical protein [Bacteroidota bacterium]